MPVDCNVNGTLYNEGTITTTGVLAFNSGSAYQHALDGGTIPNCFMGCKFNCVCYRYYQFFSFRIWTKLWQFYMELQFTNSTAVA